MFCRLHATIFLSFPPSYHNTVSLTSDNARLRSITQHTHALWLSRSRGEITVPTIAHAALAGDVENDLTPSLLISKLQLNIVSFSWVEMTEV